MRADKTLWIFKTEKDYDFKAWRLLDGQNNQVFAVLFNFNKRGWVLRLIYKQGSGYIGSKSLSIGWKTDSARWWKQFRNIKKDFFGLEITTKANGPYMAR